MVRRLFISALAIVMGIFSYAQGIVVPKHMLDSLANPPVDCLETLVFDRVSFDLGIINEDGEPRQCRFKVINKDSRAIELTSISTSCGCTVANAGQNVLKSGEDTEIVVFFNPKGQSGKQRRWIYIYTDLNKTHPSAALSIVAEVVPGKIPFGFKVLMGALACSRNTVRFRLGANEERAVERVAVKNIGNAPMTPGAMKELLPKWLELRCEPETIEPDGDADIIISIDRTKMPTGMLEGSAKVIIDGPDTRPSQRTLEILYEIEKL